MTLNVALEADSLRLQTHIVADGGAYALLGPHAIAGASKDYRLQSSRLIDPPITRHIALVDVAPRRDDPRMPDSDAGHPGHREVRRGCASPG